MQWRSLTRTLLSDLFMFGALHGVFSFLVLLTVPGPNHFLTALLLLAPFYGMTLIRLKTNSLPLFLGLHLLVCTWPLWISVNPALRYWMVLFMLVAMLRSMLMRLWSGWWPGRSLTMVMVCSNAAAVIMADYVGLPIPVGVFFFWSLTMMLCHLICEQTARVDGALDLLSGTVRQPVETTLRFNNFILVLFLAPVTLLGGLASLLPLNKVGRLLMDLILLFYLAINNLLYRLLYGGEEMTQQAPPAAAPDMASLLPQAQESPAWLLIVERVFFFLVQAVVIVLLVHGAIKGLQYLYRLFYAEQAGGGEVREYIGPMLTPEDLQERVRQLRFRLPGFDKSEEDRIRRTYYRKVRRHIRKGVEVHPADTTGEIAEHLKERENVEELTQKYNKARYNSKKK